MGFSFTYSYMFADAQNKTHMKRMNQHQNEEILTILTHKSLAFCSLHMAIFHQGQVCNAN